MRFVWDENKNRANRAKHHIAFETAVRVFEDPSLLMRPESVRDGEERWQSLGYVRNALLAVTHTYRKHGGEDVCRIISARTATSHERRLYEEDP